jgi:hypothetical protein
MLFGEKMADNRTQLSKLTGDPIGHLLNLIVDNSDHIANEVRTLSALKETQVGKPNISVEYHLEKRNYLERILSRRIKSVNFRGRENNSLSLC